MEIYVDMFIIQNSILNFCILHLTGVFLKTKIKYLRYILAAIGGSIYSFLILYFQIESIFIKLIVVFLMCYIAYNPKTLNLFLKSLVSFLCISFLLGGIIYGIIGILNSIPENKSGFVININNSQILLGIAMLYLIGFIMYKLWVKYISLKNLIWNVKVKIDNVEYKFTALLDTGNRVKDKYTGYPIIFASKDSCNIFKCIGGDEGIFFEVKVGTVASDESMIGTVCSNIIVSQGNKSCSISRCVICFTDKKLDSSDKYNAIIGYEMLLESKWRC